MSEIIREIFTMFDNTKVDVRCNNPNCGYNKNLDCNRGQSQLIGRFVRGTKGEIKCPRCGMINIFEVK